MGQQELIAALRSDCEEKLKAMRHNAELEAERLRAETDRELKRLHDEYVRKQTALKKSEQGISLSAAEEKIRRLRADAEKDLAGRLHETARGILREPGIFDREGVFAALAGEIPVFNWQTVSVDPHDVVPAKQAFPGAVIVADSTITGGMVACAEDGRICVINTLEKRLERIWDEMLVSLIKDAYESVSS